MVALVRPPKTLQEAYDVYGKDFVEGPGAIGIGRIADRYDQSGNLIEYGLRPIEENKILPEVLLGGNLTGRPPQRFFDEYGENLLDFYEIESNFGPVVYRRKASQEYLNDRQPYSDISGIVSEPMLMMPVYNRQPYSDISGIFNTNASQEYLNNRQPYSDISGIFNTNAIQDYLEFLRSLGIEI